jgi:hypothetical protein
MGHAEGGRVSFIDIPEEDLQAPVYGEGRDDYSRWGEMPPSENIDDRRGEDVTGMLRLIRRGRPWQEQEEAPAGWGLHQRLPLSTDRLSVDLGYNEVGLQRRPMRPQFRDPLAAVLPGIRGKYDRLYDSPAGAY